MNMSNEGDGSGGSDRVRAEQGSRRTPKITMPSEQIPHQPSRGSDALPSSPRAPRTAPSTEPKPHDAEPRSHRLIARPDLRAERSISVRSLQEHLQGGDRAAGTIPVVDRTQAPLQSFHPLASSARLQTASSLEASESSTPKREPQNRAADPGRHESQLRTSPRRGPVERAAQMLTVPSEAGASDAGHLGGSPSRTSISAASSSSGRSSRRPASQTSPSRAATSPSRGLPGSSGRRIQLFIETELMISARDEQQHKGHDQSDFMRILMENHNRQPTRHEQHVRSPMRIFSFLNPPDVDDEKWYITQSIARHIEEYPHPLRLQSPTFNIRRDSRWRAQISATWEYLLQHYHVVPNPVLGSQIDIMLAPHYTLPHLRRIASSAIHFEPAIEALLPEHRPCHPDTQVPANPNARSNWLDSPFLARQAKSRSQSIDAIENAPDKEAVIRLMTGPENKADPWSNRSYAWIFSDLSDNNMIGFRKAPTPTSANDVLNWAEFLITFIQAAIHSGSGASLKGFPSDLRGLRSFLAAAPGVAGVNEPRRWQKLWAGKQANAAVEPTPWWGTQCESVDSGERNRVSTRLRVDVDRIRKEAGHVLE